MIIRLLVSLGIIFYMLSCSGKEQRDIENKKKSIDSTFVNPVFDGHDPWYIKHNGYYYYCYSKDNGIGVSRSRLMTRMGIKKQIWKAPDTGWNRTNIWAPELHHIDGRWYVYYAAGKSGPPFIYQRAGVLRSKSDDPMGEYEDLGMLQTSDDPENPDANVWAIDLTVFKHNGQLYAVWSGWKESADTDRTPQHLYIAPMKNPYTIGDSRVKISSPTESWETGGELDINEGPEVLKNGGDLFIIYSCRESWLKYYRLGQLRLKISDSDPLSPDSWVKSGPVFRGTEKVLGVGHASFTKSPDGTEDWIIYHSKKSEEPGWERDVRMQPFEWHEDGSPDFGAPVPAGKPLLRPSGEIAVEKELNSEE